MSLTALPRARLSPLERCTLSAFVAAVRDVVGPRLAAVTLFGSRARGEGDRESDLDLHVEVRDLTPGDRVAIVERAADLSFSSGLRLSPLVRAPGALGPDSALGRAIASEGVAL